MKILVTGADGQLGKSLQALAHDFPHLELHFKNRTALDITDFKAVAACIKKHAIAAVINCAAYTAVDRAEEEEEKANAINSEGVKNVVKALEPIQGKLIHLSTDYVFDGKAVSPYPETASRNPQSVYGKTKMAGEEYVLQADLDALVIRTSWVFSPYGNNFVKTMLRLMAEKDSVAVVKDQIGRPTYAPFLAEVLLNLIGSHNPLAKQGKLYHYAQSGACSWFDLAQEIQKGSPFSCAVKPISTDQYPTAAPRPKYSVLSTDKIETDFGIKPRSWETALKACLQSLNLPL